MVFLTAQKVGPMEIKGSILLQLPHPSGVQRTGLRKGRRVESHTESAKEFSS